MTVATGNFAELLWPGLRTIYGNTYESFPSVFPRIYNMLDSDRAFEKVQGVTTLGLAGVKEQGGTAAYADPIQGYQKEIAHVTYALGSSVTREMYEDDQYSYITQIPQMLAESMKETKETVMAGPFNNGFSTELAADGQAFFSSTHVNAASGTNQSNIPTTAADLTQTSLEQAFIDIAGWTDDQDKRKQYSPSRLLVPRQLRFVAQKILRTTGEVGTDANTINPMNGALDMIEWTYLTDTDAWFVLVNNVRGGLMHFTRRAADLERDNEFDTMNLKMLSSERYGFGVADWRAAWASAGA